MLYIYYQSCSIIQIGTLTAPNILYVFLLCFESNKSTAMEEDEDSELPRRMKSNFVLLLNK